MPALSVRETDATPYWIRSVRFAAAAESGLGHPILVGAASGRRTPYNAQRIRQPFTGPLLKNLAGVITPSRLKTMPRFGASASRTRPSQASAIQYWWGRRQAAALHITLNESANQY